MSPLVISLLPLLTLLCVAGQLARSHSARELYDRVCRHDISQLEHKENIIQLAALLEAQPELKGHRCQRRILTPAAKFLTETNQLNQCDKIRLEQLASFLNSLRASDNFHSAVGSIVATELTVPMEDACQLQAAAQLERSKRLLDQSAISVVSGGQLNGPQQSARQLAQSIGLSSSRLADLHAAVSSKKFARTTVRLSPGSSLLVFKNQCNGLRLLYESHLGALAALSSANIKWTSSQVGPLPESLVDWLAVAQLCEAFELALDLQPDASVAEGELKFDSILFSANADQHNKEPPRPELSHAIDDVAEMVEPKARGLANKISRMLHLGKLRVRRTKKKKNKNKPDEWENVGEQLGAAMLSADDENNKKVSFFKRLGYAWKNIHDPEVRANLAYTIKWLFIVLYWIVSNFFKG